MSVKVQHLVYDSDVGPANKRLVLLALADNANDRGYCKPGVAYLVGKTQVGRSTVFRILDQLENADDLIERRERRRANGSRRSNAYRINLEELARRRRVVSKDEADELEALFDDDPDDVPDADEPAVQPHGPAPGLCADGDAESPAQPHSPAPGPSDRIVPERDGGSPGAGRAGGPGAGPLEPSVGPSGGGGGPTPRTPPAVTRPAAPPPVLLDVDLDDPDTWVCRRCAANPVPPGEWRPPCGPCGGVRKHARQQLADRDRARQASERAAAEVAAACRLRGWCNADGHVLEPGRGYPLTPLTRCTHDRDPELVAAEVRAADAPPPPEEGPLPSGARQFRRKSQLTGVSDSRSATG